MSKMIQIRHVPDSLHRELKIRAAQCSMTLSDFLLRELEESAARPTLEQFKERLMSRAPVDLKRSVADILRVERAAR